MDKFKLRILCDYLGTIRAYSSRINAAQILRFYSKDLLIPSSKCIPGMDLAGSSLLLFKIFFLFEYGRLSTSCSIPEESG